MEGKRDYDQPCIFITGCVCDYDPPVPLDYRLDPLSSTARDLLVVLRPNTPITVV